MKRFRLLALLLILMIPVQESFSYKLLYAEQFYKLYHSHYIQYPEDSAENIYYLETALKRPFENPLNAIGVISSEKEWERYRNLFVMHVYLKLVEQYRLLAVKYDKHDAYFFNYPWKQENLKSLQMAELYYNDALYYWDRAIEAAASCTELPYSYIEGIEYWEDELIRMNSGELDYAEFIGYDLERLTAVREKFNSMNPDTY